MDHRREGRLAEDPRELGPRLVGVAAGAWLFASAFLWPHTETQRGTCFIVGVIVAAVAGVGSRSPQMRVVLAVAASWLFLSSFAMPTLAADTIVSDVFVSIVVFASAVMDGAAPPRADTTRGGILRG